MTENGKKKPDVRKQLTAEERLFLLRPDGFGLFNTVASRSRSGKAHSVTLWISDARGYHVGDLSCDCESAIFGKGKECWHEQAVRRLAVGTILRGILAQRIEALSAEPMQVTLEAMKNLEQA